MRWALLLFTVGCVSGPGETTLPVRDYEAFVEHAQPVLAELCANPSCHGNESRPLRIYAPMRYRAESDRVLVDEALDADELRANYERARVFVDGLDPGRSELLRKPLARAAGGSHHTGDDPFTDETDRGYAALQAWVMGVDQ